MLRIRQRREQLGMTVAAITKALGFSYNYWSQVENDRKVLTEEKLKILFGVLEIDDAEQERLLALRGSAKERGWWSDYSTLFSEELLRLYGLEHGAYGMRTFASLLVPGLLQTADYAHAVISSDTDFIRQIEVEQRVAVRLRRQERLCSDDPLQLTAVISQAALLQQFGGAKVLHAQLLHVISLIGEYDNIDVRVVPFSATKGVNFGGAPFYLIDFPDPLLPTLAWHESVAARGVIDDPAKVRDLNYIHAHAESEALSREDSLELIERTARELT